MHVGSRLGGPHASLASHPVDGVKKGTGLMGRQEGPRNTSARQRQISSTVDIATLPVRMLGASLVLRRCAISRLEGVSG